MLALTVVLAICIAAAVTDTLSRRIPNALTISLALVGVALNAIHGWHALLAGLAITIVLLVAGTVLHGLGAMGGGDVKLIAAAGGTLNYPDALSFLIYTLLAGGLLAVAGSALQGRLVRTVRSTVAIGASLVAGVSPAVPASSAKVPYGIAIACGAAVVALSHTLVPALRLLR